MVTKITMDEIPEDVNFEGYYWLSDQDRPVVLFDAPFKKSNTNNPFIIEALLYDPIANASYHVRHTGEYHVHKYSLNDLPETAEIQDVEFLPHRLEKVRKVFFKQIWMPEKDPYCEGMAVLTMKALVFTGFEKI